MALIKRIYSIAIGSTAMASTGAYASYLNRNTEIINSKYRLDESTYRGVDYQMSWDSDDDSDGFLNKEEKQKVRNDNYILGRCKTSRGCTDQKKIREILSKNRASKLFDFRFI